MLQSRQAVIADLMKDDNNRCCPNCRSKTNLEHHGYSDRHESFRCGLCGQEWNVSYRLIFSPEIGPPMNNGEERYIPLQTTGLWE